MLAQESADTPFQFEGGALEVLEFFECLQLVAGHTAGPEGAARILARRPSPDPGIVRSDLEPVAELLALMAQGGEVLAAAVPPLRPVLSRLRLDGSVLEGLELHAICQTLAAGRSSAAELRRIAASAPAAARLLVPVPDPSLERALADSVDEAGELLDTASPELFRARREVHRARERLIRKLETLLGHAEAGGAVTVRNGRYVIPVRRDSRARPDGIVHDESAGGATLFVEPAAAIELGNALRAAVAEADREALRVLRALTERLRPHTEALAAAHEMCVALDDLVARARYGRSVGATAPAVLEPGAGVTLLGARHPLLLGRGVAVVPFDLVLLPGESTLLISGPNTGGKTVLLKTVGLAVALAQSGVVPPVAGGSALPVFDHLVADIGDHQSIAADLSTFSAHLATLRRVLEVAGRRTLVLIDEIGSGTDPAEGAALAAAALLALTRRGARTIATTHLGALKALATQAPGIINGSLQFDAERLAPTFRFRKGTPGRSYGLAIARRLGIDGDVLADAEGRVSTAEQSLDALLEAAEARERQLAADQALLADRLARAEQEGARLAAEAEAQRSRALSLRARERDADRRARAEARHLLLEARGRVEAALRAAARARSEEEARAARRLLEDAIRVEGVALDQDDELPQAVPTTGALEPGGRVRLPSGAVGTVAEVRGDGRVVVRAGAVRLVVPGEGLQPLPDVAPTAPASRPASGPERPDAGAPMEVDLRGLRGDEAESVALAAVDAAVLADHPFLRIIHGMGTGVVREAVRRVLASDRRVRRFEFAPRAQGGTGVTVVEFRA